MDWAPGVRTGGGGGGGDEETPFVHMLTTHEFEFEPVHTLLRPPPRVRRRTYLNLQPGIALVLFKISVNLYLLYLNAE